MITVLLVKLSLFFVSLALVAYFASAETALTSLSTLSLGHLRERHPALKKYIVSWEEKPNEVLATVVVGINLALIGSGVLATSIALDLSAEWEISDTLLLIVVPASAAVLTLTFGQIVPKIISRYQPERVAVFALPALARVNRILSPVARTLLRLAEKFIALFKKGPARETPFLQPEELRVLLLSEETLPIPGVTRRLLENVLDFGKTRISQIMVPRTEIQAVNLDQDREKTVDQITEKGYSRVPVYRGSLDNIVGIIYSKDLTLAWRGESLFLIEDLIRPAYFVPESARIDQVLREFRKGHQHLAVVVDEFGSTAGLVTLEDIVEEIVGEIWDEYDIQEKTIVRFPDGSWLLRASENLDRVNEELQIGLPSEEFNTVSGWVLDLFGRIPRPGDTIRWDDLEVEVVDADKKKVQRVRIRKISDKR